MDTVVLPRPKDKCSVRERRGRHIPEEGLLDHETKTEARDILLPRGRVTEAELEQMPATLKPCEAWPWTRQSRSAFYQLLSRGELPAIRLGHSIRIPTRRFLLAIGVLEEPAGPAVEAAGRETP